MNGSKDKKDISIILPTYNEAENIEIAINKIYQVLGDRNFEIIIVNNRDGIIFSFLEIFKID